MTAAIRAPQPIRPVSPRFASRPSAMQLVEPGWSPSPSPAPATKPAGSPLVLVPGGREAVLRRRRTPAVYRRRRWAAAILGVATLFVLLATAQLVEGRVLSSSAETSAVPSDPAPSGAPAAGVGVGIAAEATSVVVQPGSVRWSIASSSATGAAHCRWVNASICGVSRPDPSRPGSQGDVSWCRR